jgi:hypothetical protein
MSTYTKDDWEAKSWEEVATNNELMLDYGKGLPLKNMQGWKVCELNGSNKDCFHGTGFCIFGNGHKYKCSTIGTRNPLPPLHEQQVQSHLEAFNQREGSFRVRNILSKGLNCFHLQETTL